MLQAIIDFFKNLFSGGKKETTSSSPTTPVEIPTTEDDLPEIVDVEPQDGADMPLEELDEDVVLVNVEVDVPVIEEAPVTTSEPDAPTNTTDSDPPKETTPAHTPRYLWILDNGHGQKTKGKRSPKWEDGKQVLEYELNRGVVKKIIESLEAKGVQYHNLVPEENVGNILKTRVARANALKVTSDLPPVYISIHSNAGPEDQPGNWSSAKGIETWYYRTSLDGRKIAKIFQKNLISKTKWSNRGVRTGMAFYVLKYTSMPAILTENGFFNHKIEGRKLLKEETRQLIADAHVNAIIEIEKYGFKGFQG
ncbi:MAG: N-acetylmuramoyl-L-alanine amidase [Granulosicoccus sp.]|jgi:N-acetylmuramoyl-L-alanine amidase